MAYRHSWVVLALLVLPEISIAAGVSPGCPEVAIADEKDQAARARLDDSIKTRFGLGRRGMRSVSELTQGLSAKEAAEMQRLLNQLPPYRFFEGDCWTILGFIKVPKPSTVFNTNSQRERLAVLRVFLTKNIRTLINQSLSDKPLTLAEQKALVLLIGSRWSALRGLRTARLGLAWWTKLDPTGLAKWYYHNRLKVPTSVPKGETQLQAILRASGVTTSLFKMYGKLSHELEVMANLIMGLDTRTKALALNSIAKKMNELYGQMKTNPEGGDYHLLDYKYRVLERVYDLVQRNGDRMYEELGQKWDEGLPSPWRNWLNNQVLPGIPNKIRKSVVLALYAAVLGFGTYFGGREITRADFNVPIPSEIRPVVDPLDQGTLPPAEVRQRLREEIAELIKLKADGKVTPEEYKSRMDALKRTHEEWDGLYQLESLIYRLQTKQITPLQYLDEIERLLKAFPELKEEFNKPPPEP